MNVSQTQTCGPRPSGRLVNDELRFGSVTWLLRGDDVTAAGSALLWEGYHTNGYTHTERCASEVFRPRKSYFFGMNQTCACAVGKRVRVQMSGRPRLLDALVVCHG